MKNPSTISSGERDERALQYVEALNCLSSVMRAASHVLVGLPASEKEAKLRDVLSKAHDWYMAERAALATQPAESKACASVGVVPAKRIDAETISLARAWADWLKTNDAPINAASRETLAGVLSRCVASLASPATSVGEPVTVEAVATVRRVDGNTYLDWLIEGGIAAMAEGQVLLISGGANLTDDTGSGEVYLTPPAAPAATEAPSVPFAYYIHIAAEQRGEFVHDLDEAMDDLTNCECKITELFDHATPAPAVGASEKPIAWLTADLRRVVSNLRLEQARRGGGAIQSGLDAYCVPAYRHKPDAAVGASVQPAAGALPPVRWWSGVVGSPEKLANLLDGYSEKKESPRRDERVMRAAAKWIREVVASVQPVLASLSDEQITAMAEEIDNDVAFIAGFGRGYGAALAALASSTPTKGGEAS